jgi:uncharacterized membrane protein YfcA
MTAAAMLSAASAAVVPWLDGSGEVLLWIAVAAWLVAAVGAVAAARAAVRPPTARHRAPRLRSRGPR